MEIREFSWPGDYEGVLEMWHAAGVYNPSIDSPATVREVSERNPGLFLLAVEPDGRIAASVIGTFDGRRAYLYHVATHPGFRRRGYATRLVREAERRLWEMGAQKIRFMVVTGNEPAIAFYKSLGYDVDTHAVSMSKARGG